LPFCIGLYYEYISLIGKIILFKFKILIKVILKYKLQSQQVKRIQKVVVWGKVKGKKRVLLNEKGFCKETFVLRIVSKIKEG
jgi:hypothetical protein